MVQKETRLKVADNSGAKLLLVIGIKGSTRKRFATVGEQVKVTIKRAIPGGSVKKGDVMDALLVRTRKECRRADGTYIRFDENAAVLLDKQGNAIGTRVFGPIAREVRGAGYMKIVSLAPEVL